MGFKSFDRHHNDEHDRIAATLLAQDVRDPNSEASGVLNVTFAPRIAVTANKPMQASIQAVTGRCVIGSADGGQVLLSWDQYLLAQSDNGGTGWIARNSPADVSDSYAAAGKAVAVIFKGDWYMQAIKISDGLPSVFRAPRIAGAGSFAWSGPLITADAGSTLISTALNADDSYLYWGEYGDPVGGPKAWRSADGTTWEQMTVPGLGRHVHAIAPDPYNPGHVWLSGGDTTSTVYNYHSTDYGATWTPAPGALGTDGSWQAVQISFDADHIYMAPDTITALPMMKIDRATLTPTWGARESHRFRAVPGGIPARRVNDLSATAGSAILTSETANFTAADVGSMLRTAGQNIVPIGTYIKSVDSPTQVTMWQLSLVTVAGATATFGAEVWGAACYYGAVDPSTGIYYFATLNGAFGGNVDGLFAIYPDGTLALLDIVNTSPDSRMFICPATNRLWVQGFSHSLLTVNG